VSQTTGELPNGVAAEFSIDVSRVVVSVSRNGSAASLNDLTSALWTAATYRFSSGGLGAVVVIVAVVLGAVHPLLTFLALAIGGVLVVAAQRKSAARKRVGVSFRIDEAATRAFDSLRNGTGWLRASQRVWRIASQEVATRPANTFSIDRVRAAATEAELPPLVTNIAIPSIEAGAQTLIFLPNTLLVRDHVSNFVSVAWETVTLDFQTMQFSESQDPPSDSSRVGASWLYANKNGGPDRRRSNNRQIPLLEYARVTLSWPRSGCALLVSNVTAARHFANAVQDYVRSRTPAVKSVAPAKEQQAVAIQPATPKQRPPALPQKPRTDDTFRWIGPGGTTTVQGFATGDLVYVGSSVPPAWRTGSDPAMIDPRLTVHPTDANVSGAGINYWPSYSALTPASRRAFLQWLDGGRKDPDAYIGYVFIFYYGLERRVWEFVNGHGFYPEEIFAIAREVRRLHALYAPKSGSFAGYSNSFLQFLAMAEPRTRQLHAGAALQVQPGGGVPADLKVAMGELAAAGKPLPADYALLWVRSCSFLNTPVTRCAREFELLFHIRYAKEFGDGFVVKPNKTMIESRYGTATSAFGEIKTKSSGIPDVTALQRPLAKLTDLARECSDALDPFSRFLGRNPHGRESLAAFALLPEELVEATPSPDAQALASLVQARGGSDGLTHMAAAELLQFVRLTKPDRTSKQESVQLAQALEKLGYGVEPDVRLGGPVFEAEGRVILFRRLPDCPSAASEEYATAALCMRFGVIVSAADSDISEAELAALRRNVDSTFELSPGERQRLTAHLAWLVDAKPGTAGVKKFLGALTSAAKRHIADLLVIVAASDGRVDASEMKMLEKLYELIGVETGQLYAEVHAALAGVDEPLTVETAAAVPRAFAIPPKPESRPQPVVDMERVRLKIAETRQVSTLLSTIFSDDDVAPPTAQPARAEGTIGTLDAAHSEFLRRLAARESWSRGEIEQLAAQLLLMTDGALETVNDYAYAAADEPLWEDDDPVSVNTKIAKELIP
jgi:uncharacterized tellurite resistance protein B-like protein